MLCVYSAHHNKISLLNFEQPHVCLRFIYNTRNLNINAAVITSANTNIDGTGTDLLVFLIMFKANGYTCTWYIFHHFFKRRQLLWLPVCRPVQVP